MSRFLRSEFHGKDLVRNGIYVETGTGDGNSLADAKRMPFQKFFTCDIRYEAIASDHMRWLTRDGRATATQIDCVLYLRAIADRWIRWQPMTFFLDAYYEGDPKALRGESGECPVLAELGHIFNPELPWTINPIVLIANARMFHPEGWTDALRTVYREAEWPTLRRIKSAFPAVYCIYEEENILWCLPVRVR